MRRTIISTIVGLFIVLALLGITGGFVAMSALQFGNLVQTPAPLQVLDTSIWGLVNGLGFYVDPAPNDAASAMRGKKLYAEYCLSCHLPTGRGSGPGDDNVEPHASDFASIQAPPAEFFVKLKEGRGPMPGFGASLTDQQLWDLVNYVEVLSHQNTSTS